jgi:hypothetical protein
MIVPWFAACTKGDLSRAKAAELMNKEYAQFLSSGCAVNSALAKKIEFVSPRIDPRQGEIISELIDYQRSADPAGAF